jgi:hypothetical protein
MAGLFPVASGITSIAARSTIFYPRSAVETSTIKRISARECNFSLYLPVSTDGTARKLFNLTGYFPQIRAKEDKNGPRSL